MCFINVNPLSLNSGSINFAEIHGFDSSNISLGQLFKFRITVVVSKLIMKKEKSTLKNDIILYQQIPYSIFLHSPTEKSQCFVKSTAFDDTIPIICFKYATQNGIISDDEYEIFTPKRSYKIFSIPSMSNDQLIENALFRFDDNGKTNANV